MRVVYEQLCQSYRAIDDFRAKLLGLLPLASGAGVAALFGSDAQLRMPAGWFGLFVTLGLFSFEIHGIRKCHGLINAGKQLELDMGISRGGQFCTSSAHVINEPFAAGIVYSSVAATWLYLALQSREHPWLPVMCAFVAIVGFAATLFFDRWWLPKVEPPLDCTERAADIAPSAGHDASGRVEGSSQ